MIDYASMILGLGGILVGWMLSHCAILEIRESPEPCGLVRLLKWRISKHEESMLIYGNAATNAFSRGEMRFFHEQYDRAEAKKQFCEAFLSFLESRGFATISQGDV